MGAGTDQPLGRVLVGRWWGGGELAGSWVTGTELAACVQLFDTASASGHGGVVATGSSWGSWVRTRRVRQVTFTAHGRPTVRPKSPKPAPTVRRKRPRAKPARPKLTQFAMMLVTLCLLQHAGRLLRTEPMRPTVCSTR